MWGMNEKTLASLREQYPKGCRVVLTHMNDPWNHKLTEGCEGTVVSVDDIGTYGKLNIMESVTVRYTENT